MAGKKSVDEMSLEQLNALSDELDAKRGEIMERKRELNAARVRLLAAEHAALYGMTPEQYQEAKESAKAGGEPLVVALGRARKANATQVAKALAARVGAQAKGT